MNKKGLNVNGHIAIPTQTGTQVAEPDATDYVVHEALDSLWETVFAGEPQQ